MVWFDQDYVIRLIQQSQDEKGLLTNVPCRHRRGEEEEEEEEEHKIKLNFYSRTQLSLIIYKNKRSFYKLEGCSIYSLTLT